MKKAHVLFYCQMTNRIGFSALGRLATWKIFWVSFVQGEQNKKLPMCRHINLPTHDKINLREKLEMQQWIRIIWTQSNQLIHTYKINDAHLIDCGLLHQIIYANDWTYFSFSKKQRSGLQISRATYTCIYLFMRKPLLCHPSWTVTFLMLQKIKIKIK